MESSSPSQQTPLLNEELSKSDGTKYKEIISTFPKAKGWNKSYDLHQYQGFWYHPFFLETVMSVQENFKPQSTDIFITSFPKTGTTWLKALTFAIVTRSRFRDSTASPLLTKVPHDCIPFLGVDVADNSSNRDLAIPLESTHLPYSSLPKSIISSGCKIIYICRDAKDVFVSLWHFFAKQRSSENVEPLPVEEAFDLFCNGFVHTGPYWDHASEYWKASLEFSDKVLFLTYEEMKKDTAPYVKKLAEFMGYSFTLEEEEEGEVQEIINMCSFENLSNLEVNKYGKHRADTCFPIQNSTFFRKGEIGDWANHLTVEMGARLDNIMEEKLKGSGLRLTK